MKTRFIVLFGVRISKGIYIHANWVNIGLLNVLIPRGSHFLNISGFSGFFYSVLKLVLTFFHYIPLNSFSKVWSTMPLKIT